MFFAQPKTVVGLDVGSYAVKAVALQGNKDRVTLQGYAQARVDGGDVGETIRRVMEQLGVKGRRVVSSVSGRSVIVRQVETPKLAPDELKAHISYEADKYIPFGTEEVIIDAQPLPDRAGAKASNQQVMLVAVRKSFVQEHIAQLRAAGAMPQVIDVDVFALANAYELLGPPAPTNEAEAKKATALIDIGASKSNIAIVQGARVLFTREVYLAGNEISDAVARTFNEPVEDIDRIKLAPGEALDALIDAAMPAFEDLANEIRLSFDYVEGQFDAEVGTVVLTGGSSQLPNAASILGNILGRPVHVFDPLAGLDLVPSRYDIHTLDANSPGLTVALGLAAHLLNHGSVGLGGQQSHNWQPRHAGAGAAARPTPAAAPEVPAAPSTTVLRQQSPVIPSPAIPSPLLTPPTLPPPPRAQHLAPPPSAPAALTPPPDIPDEPGTNTIRNSTEMFLSDKQRSGLLVVLDDDEDLPKSERIERGNTNVRTRSGELKVEGFGEDNPSGVDLPDLPKL